MQILGHVALICLFWLFLVYHFFPLQQKNKYLIYPPENTQKSYTGLVFFFSCHCDCVTRCSSLYSDNCCREMDVSLETHQVLQWGFVLGQWSMSDWHTRFGLSSTTNNQNWIFFCFSVIVSEDQPVNTWQSRSFL